MQARPKKSVPYCTRPELSLFKGSPATKTIKAACRGLKVDSGSPLDNSENCCKINTRASLLVAEPRSDERGPDPDVGRHMFNVMKASPRAPSSRHPAAEIVVSCAASFVFQL